MTKGFVIQNSKRLIAVLLALILALTLAACGGDAGTTEKLSGGNTAATTTQNDDDAATQSSPMPVQGDNTPPVPPASADNPVSQAIETTPKDGDFLYLTFGGISPDEEYNGQNTQGLYDASILFAGDTSETEYLDISEFTVLIDGEAQPFTASNVIYESGRYDSYNNTTRYNILLSETFSETDPPIPFQPAEVWIEAVIAGSAVRSRTLDWQEDGQQHQLDDASISQPLTLEVTIHESELPDFTEEEFYAYHYINDDEIPDNGTPPAVPAPLENHRGDKAYFYVASDDYIIRTLRGKSPITNIFSTTYEIYNFIDGVCVNVCNKYVYDRVEDSFVGDRSAYFTLRDITRNIKHIDNVIYGEVENDTDDHYAIGMTKSELLESLERRTGEIYDSMAQ